MNECIPSVFKPEFWERIVISRMIQLIKMKSTGKKKRKEKKTCWVKYFKETKNGLIGEEELGEMELDGDFDTEQLGKSGTCM